MVDVPAVTPVTIPLVPTVAFGSEALHTPPGSPVGSLRAVVVAGHTVSEPVITPAKGPGFMVTTCVTLQLAMV